MTRIYRILLKLYPRDFRSRFASEMQSAFDAFTQEHQGTAFLRLAVMEIATLLKGALSEWVAKSSTSSLIRGRSLPDPLVMRPAGVAWESWYGTPTHRDRKQCL
jgi:hypothetical protein